MDNNFTVIDEDFSSFPVGQLPTDFTAAGEYHTMPMEHGMGIWHEPMGGDWKPDSPWLIMEEDGLSGPADVNMYTKGRIELSDRNISSEPAGIRTAEWKP